NTLVDGDHQVVVDGVDGDPDVVLLPAFVTVGGDAEAVFRFVVVGTPVGLKRAILFLGVQADGVGFADLEGDFSRVPADGVGVVDHATVVDFEDQPGGANL